jgi:hypothetical protein
VTLSLTVTLLDTGSQRQYNVVLNLLALPVAGLVDEAAWELLDVEVQNKRLLVPVHVDSIGMTGTRLAFQLDDEVVKCECHHNRCDGEYVFEIRVSKEPPQQEDGTHHWETRKNWMYCPKSRGCWENIWCMYNTYSPTREYVLITWHITYSLHLWIEGTYRAYIISLYHSWLILPKGRDPRVGHYPEAGHTLRDNLAVDIIN